MFLFKKILDFIFPPYCIHCKVSLDNNVHLCEMCQQVLSHSFENAPQPFLQGQDWICPLFEKSDDIAHILTKMHRPTLNYLSVSLAALVLIKLVKYELPMPQRIYGSMSPWSIYSGKRRAMVNALRAIQARNAFSTFDLIYFSNVEEYESQKRRKVKNKGTETRAAIGVIELY